MKGESGALSSLPRSELPRERMLQKGASALADRELIAILLGSGRPGRSALDVAADLLARLGNLRALALSGAEPLVGVPGVGTGKAARLLAAVELGRRVVRFRKEDPYPIRSPKDAAHLLMDEMRSLDREEFRVLLLDAKNRVIGVEIVSIGTLTASLIHPREGLKAAIVRSAASIILVHNHPTGVPTPSREDIEITERFAEAGRVIGIDVLDHVIIGDGRFESLREMGYL
ncbi:MAG: DNA repair protein RadC [Candidatus Eisenbacteria bacterium]|nr:DNA repair protein RadC [Candidatus Eisenbacteria bacterium]